MSSFPLWSAFIIMGPFGRFHRDRHNAPLLGSISHWMIKVPRENSRVRLAGFYGNCLLNPACILPSLHVGVCLFIIGATCQCPSNYVGAISTSTSEVILSFEIDSPPTPIPKWWERHKLCLARKYSPSSSRPCFIYQHNNGDLWGCWRCRFRTFRVRHHLGSCIESQTG